MTVPHSVKPNPKLNNEFITSAFLSNPAAIPMGFLNLSPLMSLLKIEISLLLSINGFGSLSAFIVNL